MTQGKEDMNSSRPNIVLFYLDDLDFDETGVYDPMEFPCYTGASELGLFKENMNPWLAYFESPAIPDQGHTQHLFGEFKKHIGPGGFGNEENGRHTAVHAGGLCCWKTFGSDDSVECLAYAGKPFFSRSGSQHSFFVRWY